MSGHTIKTLKLYVIFKSNSTCCFIYVAYTNVHVSSGNQNLVFTVTWLTDIKLFIYIQKCIFTMLKYQSNFLPFTNSFLYVWEILTVKVLNVVKILVNEKENGQVYDWSKLFYLNESQEIKKKCLVGVIFKILGKVWCCFQYFDFYILYVTSQF